MTGTSQSMSSRVIPAGLAVLALLAVGGFVGSREASSNTLRATFTDASPLVAGNYVKTDGVTVGTVKSIELRNGKAELTMELDDAVLPVHRDATLTIRTKTLLGEKYVDLDRGTDSAPQLDLPGRIPTDRTTNSTDLQDVLNTLDDPTSTATAALLVTLGEGTSGRGRDIDATLKGLAPVFNGAEVLSQILDEQNAALIDLIDEVTPVAQAVATDDGQQAERLVESAENALTALADERAALDDSLERLPDTLSQARTSLKEVSGMSDETTKTLKSLEPVTDDLPEIADELKDFSEAADPAMSSLVPVLERAQALVDEAGPLVRDLRPGIRGLRTVAAGAHPIADELLPRIAMVLDFAKWWALATADGDGVGQYFKGVVPVTPQALLNIPGIHLPNALTKTSDEEVAATEPGEGAEAGEDSGTAGVNGVLNGVTGTVDSLTDSVTGGTKPAVDPDSATGLEEKQEQGLLGQLLGVLR